jgi:hypothetical protein
VVTVAARKRPARKPAAAECRVCKGSGDIPISVRVGRKRRVVGQQSGFCLNCFGTGLDPND